MELGEGTHLLVGVEEVHRLASGNVASHSVQGSPVVCRWLDKGSFHVEEGMQGLIK
jgi:hypothetical protein